jgi:poly(A) polymerase
MMLCDADITSGNSEKVKRYLQNFELVRQKLKEIEEKDAIRNFQPPITGDDIMTIFGLNPGREIGILKNTLKDAILDGVIPNEYQPAYDLLIEKGKELGLKAVK